MAINNVFREMFNEQKREKELQHQKEIIMKTLECQGSMISDFEMRYEEKGILSKKSDTKFKTKNSDLGFIIDIPEDWIELEPKNKNCFDAVAIDNFNDDVIFNIKMQVFLIEIPENMAGIVNLDRVANNMGCIDSIDFNNENCEGKLICGEGIDGTCNYIFMAKGKRGIYDVRVIVDKFLEPLYEDIIDHIIYSFDIID